MVSFAPNAKRFAVLLTAVLVACESADDIASPVAGRGAHMDVTASYEAIDISTSLPGHNTAVHAVNASGVVLGMDRTNPPKYFTWSQSAGLTFPLTDAGDPFYPDGINDRGDVFGEVPLGGGLRMHWADDTWQEIPVPASFDWVAGQAINEHGHIAGVYAEPGGDNLVTFMWTKDGGYTQIHRACDVVPFGISGADQVVGYVRETCDSPQEVFSWTPAGGFRNLGTFGGASAFGSAVNVHGVIAATVTYADGHTDGVLISPSLAVTTLPNPLGGTRVTVTDINDRGEAVGTVRPPVTGATQPTYWDPSQHPTILSTPLSSGTVARISSTGIIAGQVRGTDGKTHAQVWMPAVLLDVTPPVVAYTGNAGTYTVDQAVNITCTAIDAGSGIASSTCADVVGPASSFAVGENTFTATAVDFAGNTATGTVSFTVVVEAGGVSSLVTQWVASDGVANSLVSKLSKGNYAAFRNEVAAQSGKKIPADKATILLRLAAGL